MHNGMPADLMLHMLESSFATGELRVVRLLNGGARVPFPTPVLPLVFRFFLTIDKRDFISIQKSDFCPRNVRRSLTLPERQRKTIINELKPRTDYLLGTTRSEP